MGTGASKNVGSSHGSEEREDQCGEVGGQLYISLKMENYELKGELIPHVHGSVPLVGSWDPSNALSMERESLSMWELSFVVPPNHETLDFKFLLKPKCSNAPCVVEEGPNRQLTGGTLQGDRRSAMFKLSGDEILDYRVFIKADRVSPFDLAASWRAYQENFLPSTVRGIPDISIKPAAEASNEVAALAMDDMISWMQEGGQVGILDATNSTRKRRNMLMTIAEGKCKIIFLETLCNDRQIIERNIRLKVQQSLDYAGVPDFEAGYHDFKVRLENYEKDYEPVEEGSYIKMIDMVRGHGGQIQVNISGYLPGRIVFFLVALYLRLERRILLTFSRISKVKGEFDDA